MLPERQGNNLLVHDDALRSLAILEMLIDPAANGVLPAVELLNIRIDDLAILCRQDINLHEVQPVPFDTLDLHHGETNVIGTMRAADGEDPVLLVFKKRSANSLFAVRLVEIVEQDGVAECSECFEAILGSIHDG